MDEQIRDFTKTRQYIISRNGASAAHRLLRKALYLVAIGANDIIFQQISTTRDVNDYIDNIVSKLKSQTHRFENVDSACCRVIGRRGGLIPCGSLSRVCLDRTKYVFWDPFHPTESANLIAAKHVLDGGLQYVSPINIRQPANS
ncbi:hypothetical protein CRYUN_Cryun31cG0057700 [Craigia yunnanensis]